MYQPEAYGIALLFMIGSMMCWGSWANTMKLTPGWPFQLFYWDYTAGIILGSLIWGLTLGSLGGGQLSFLNNIRTADSTHITFALLGGVVFNVANLLLVAAIEVAGLAVAFPIGIGLALVVGVLLMVVLSTSSCGLPVVWKVPLAMPPPTSVAMFPVMTGGQPVTMRDYFRGQRSWHYWGILGGVIWCTGAVLNFVASHAQIIGPAISYAIGQGATMVSAIWGVFIWKEFADAPKSARRLVPLMFIFFIAGLGAVAIAPVFHQ